MRRVLFFLTITTFIFCAPVNTGATLHFFEYDSHRVVHDSESTLYWYWDLSFFANKTWLEQVASVTALNTHQYYGLSTWKVANEQEIRGLCENGLIPLMHFGPTYDYPGWYGSEWIGRVDWEAWVGGEHRRYMVGVLQPPRLILPYGTLRDTDSYMYIGAWVTSTGPAPNWAHQISPVWAHGVPEPATMILLGFGLLGLVGLGRKFKK